VCSTGAIRNPTKMVRCRNDHRCPDPRYSRRCGSGRRRAPGGAKPQVIHTSARRRRTADTAGPRRRLQLAVDATRDAGGVPSVPAEAGSPPSSAPATVAIATSTGEELLCWQRAVGPAYRISHRRKVFQLVRNSNASIARRTDASPNPEPPRAQRRHSDEQLTEIIAVRASANKPKRFPQKLVAVAPR
jgi:hypothetical protein